MHELPASVRLSLWLTRALRDSTPLEQAIVQALPDVDDVAGGLDQIELWRDFGERVVCVDLPRPGVHGGLLPPGSAATSAAMSAGECLFVPSWGGVLVPELEIYGPAGDEGLKLTFVAHDGDPVPIHRLQALALPQTDRRFREALMEHVADLESLQIAPFLGASNPRARVDDRLAGAQWALPEGIAPRALRIITTAGLVVAALDEALASPTSHGGLDAASSTSRERALRSLLDEAELALAEATTAAALDLAGPR